MTSGFSTYVRFYKAGEAYNLVRNDTLGNLPQLQIRGQYVEHGDGAVAGTNSTAVGEGASAAFAHTTAIGDGIVAPAAGCAVVGSNSTGLMKANVNACVTGGPAFNHPAYLSTLTAPVTLSNGVLYPNRTFISTPSGALAFTLDTGAAYDAQFPTMAANDSFYFTIVNLSGGANTITLGGATGSSVTGTATIAQNVARVYCLVKVSPATWTAVNVYSYTAAA